MKLIAKKFPYFSDPEFYYLLNDKAEAHTVVEKNIVKSNPVIVYSVPMFRKVRSAHQKNFPPEWWLDPAADNLPDDGWVACVRM